MLSSCKHHKDAYAASHELLDGQDAFPRGIGGGRGWTLDAQHAVGGQDGVQGQGVNLLREDVLTAELAVHFAPWTLLGVLGLKDAE